MYLTFREKKIELWPAVNEFLCTLFNCISAYLVLFPFIKDLGYTSLEKYNELQPLHRFTAARTNSIFLYVCGCLAVFIVGAAYHFFIVRLRYLNKRVLVGESFISLLFAACLWARPHYNFVLGIFLLRLLASYLIYRIPVFRMPSDDLKTEYSNRIFYVLSFVVLFP